MHFKTLNYNYFERKHDLEIVCNIGIYILIFGFKNYSNLSVVSFWMQVTQAIVPVFLAMTLGNTKSKTCYSPILSSQGCTIKNT